MLGPRGPKCGLSTFTPLAQRWHSTLHGPAQVCSWDQRVTNMRAPRRANVWSKVSSTLYMYPRLQNVFLLN